MDLQGRRIPLGITGGIAAYKSAALCRAEDGGAEVRVVMTEHVSRYPQSEQVANFRKIDAERKRLQRQGLHQRLYLL